MRVKFGAAYRLHVLQGGNGNESRSAAAVAASIAGVEFRSRLLLQNKMAGSLLDLILICNYHRARASERAHATNNTLVVARPIGSHAISAVTGGMHTEKIYVMARYCFNEI